MSASSPTPAQPAHDPRDDTEAAELRDGALVSEPRDPDDTRRPRREHPTAPYLEAIVSYGFRGSVRFHVPGHKGGPGADPACAPPSASARWRSTSARTSRASTPGPRPPPTSAPRSWPPPPTAPGRRGFSPTGPPRATTRCAWPWPSPAATSLVQRNSHASIVDGLVLSGGLASFVAPEYDDELGMAHGVTPEALEQALQRSPDISAAFIVSPTYYGMAADIRGCAEVAHAAGVALVVDCAWGSHFGFHPTLPESPLRQGADAVLASTHKIVGSLTQSAMLHVAEDGLIDADEVARCVRLVRSTSPNSLLLASLDSARRQLAAHGEALLDRTIAASARAREAIEAIPGIAVVGEAMVGRPGIAGWDPLRIVIDVRGTGVTGYELAAELRAAYDIYIELATHATLVLVLGLGQPVEPLERFAHDFAETVRTLSRPGESIGHRLPERVARAPERRPDPRGVPGRGRDGPGRRRHRPHLVRVDRRLPAGRPDAAAGRAGHRRGRALPARADRRRRPPARRRRSDVRHGAGAGRAADRPATGPWPPPQAAGARRLAAEDPPTRGPRGPRVSGSPHLTMIVPCMLGWIRQMK